MLRTVRTRKGIDFDFIDPDPALVHISDIAHGLAMTCRFGGQCSEFFSVAEHSLLVASLAPPQLRLSALLHDAHEAYLGDIPSPIRQYIAHPYDVMVDKVQEAIEVHFGVTTQDVTHWDLLARQLEWKQFMQGPYPGTPAKLPDITLFAENWSVIKWSYCNELQKAIKDAHRTEANGVMDGSLSTDGDGHL